MAKRKRLDPPVLDAEEAVIAGIEPKPGLALPFGAGPPIARIAADSATTAAFEAVSEELQSARQEGRLIQALPLQSIVEDHLVRDRIAIIEDDLAALMESIRVRGQQTPIEVVDLGKGRFGLISGWRRLTALRRLHAETGDDRFGVVRALLRRPPDAAAAYVAMVEENEIRVGLSYYERARIVARSVEQGVYSSPKEALQGLFSTASRAKRSKIGSFLDLVAALDDVLRFPAQIGERAGLAVAMALDRDSGLGERLAADLRRAPAGSAEEEQRRLLAAVRRRASDRAPQTGRSASEVIPGVFLRMSSEELTLSGSGVDEAFRKRLLAWLGTQG